MEYTVRIEKLFEGPIALLHELVKASKVDIYDIPISEITHQYLEYVRMLQNLDIDVTSDFIAMAATLLYIKSRMLMPQEESRDEDDREDPRKELIDKLLEYQKFKEAASGLEEKETAQGDLIFRENKQYIIDFGDENNWVDISIYDLINAFSEIVEYVEPPAFEQMMPENLTVAMKINELSDVLKKEQKFFFGELFPENVNRFEVIVTFLAILELVKIGTVRIQQHRLFGDIRIIRRVQKEKGVQGD